MIASDPPNFMKIVFLIFITFKTYFDKCSHFQNSIRDHVWHRAFATLQIELYRVEDYDRKWSTKFHKDCMFAILLISLIRRLDNSFNFHNSIRAHVRSRAFATLQIELYV